MKQSLNDLRRKGEFQKLFNNQENFHAVAMQHVLHDVVQKVMSNNNFLQPKYGIDSSELQKDKLSGVVLFAKKHFDQFVTEYRTRKTKQVFALFAFAQIIESPNDVFCGDIGFNPVLFSDYYTKNNPIIHEDDLLDGTYVGHVSINLLNEFRESR